MGGVASYAYPICWYVMVLFDPRALFGVACPRLAARTGNRPLTAGIWLGASRAWVKGVFGWRAGVGFYVTGE